MDGLANMQVGGPASGSPNTYVAVRFRATQTSTLKSFLAYWLGPDRPGYGGGTGGTVRVTLQTDNNGVPSGTTYDIVFTNIDASPTVNFCSIDFAWISGSILAGCEFIEQ